VSEADVYLFAAVTGDSNEDHIDATSPVARRHGRIAHGAYLVALMSTASALIHQRHDAPTVSAGYDHVRFVRPVPIGTRVEVCYEVDSVDETRGRAEASIVMRNERDEVVAVARHLIAFLADDGMPMRGERSEP
jgi:acyl dehydratase